MGWTIKGGVNIYSAFEAGFNSGQVCSGGSCPGGLDILSAEAALRYSCPGNILTHPEALLDSCSGHAVPYHLHRDAQCDYDTTKISTHSPLLAIMVSGQGLYGKYEGTQGIPTDLDDCNGHWGPVPASLYNPAQSYVYHYHTTDRFPFTVGCFGPLDERNTCTTLTAAQCASTVAASAIPTYTDGITTTLSYKMYCPCRSSNPAAIQTITSVANQTNASTSSYSSNIFLVLVTWYFIIKV
jgi:hypothetical protein